MTCSKMPPTKDISLGFYLFVAMVLAFFYGFWHGREARLNWASRMSWTDIRKPTVTNPMGGYTYQWKINGKWEFITEEDADD